MLDMAYEGSLFCCFAVLLIWFAFNKIVLFEKNKK